MEIVLNGDIATLDAGCTVRELLAVRQLTGKPAAVEVNGDVVPRAKHEQYQLNEGDRVEIVTLVGGG